MSTTDRAAPAGFDLLQQRHPWPAAPPRPGAPRAGRHSSGFEMLLSALDTLGPTPVVLEVGAEFGGSTRRFLDHCACSVVSVDPWPDDYGSRSFPDLAGHFHQVGAAYELFLTFCWPYRERLVAVREMSPAGLLTVRDAGIRPDLVYIDGDHRYDAVMRDLFVADALFPDAVLSGDDWSMKSDREKYEGMLRPVRRAVTSWAAFQNVHVQVTANTWMIDRTRPFNLEPPPARFVAANAAIRNIDERLGAIEREVLTPSLARRLERKVRARLRR